MHVRKDKVTETSLTFSKSFFLTKTHPIVINIPNEKPKTISLTNCST